MSELDARGTNAGIAGILFRRSGGDVAAISDNVKNAEI